MVVHMLRLICAAAVLAVVALLPAGGRVASAATSVGPKTYYLALGDSLAYGYQPNFDWWDGYADDLYSGDLQPQGTAAYINLACPGETSGSFITGGCPYWYLRKSFYLGSQMNAALRFISAHPGQVSPVTIDIGANDALGAINPSTCTVASNWDIVLSTFDTNFKSILSTLSSALNGTGDLVAMNYYDPYQNQCAGNPDVLSKLQLFNDHIASDAAMYGVPVADVFTAFGGADTPNPNICMYTWMCSSQHDVHATSDGYLIMAVAFEDALGY